MTRLAFFALPVASLVVGCSLPYGNTPSVTPAAKEPAFTSTTTTTTTSAPAHAAAAETPAKSDDAEDGACTGDACIRRCDAKGRVKDCANAGVALHTGAGVKADEPRAAKYFQKACDLKSRDGCFHLAGLLEDGTAGPRDTSKAIALYGAACDLGRGDACHLAATRLEEGDGIAKDHKKAVALLAKGCVADDYSATACSDLRDDAKKKDREAAKTLRSWKTACSAKKDAASCLGVERTAKDAL